LADVTTHIWFGYEDGINGCYFQWAPAPVRGISVSNSGYSEGLGLQSGRRTRVRSTQYSKVYGITAVGESKDMDGYQVYNKAASGFYGRQKWGFADPYAFETNLLPAGWASPGVAESGWRRIYATDPAGYADTATNSYNQPTRKPTYSITTGANATPLTDATIPYVIVPIPPTHTLHLGCTGAATGTAVVQVESWVNKATSAGASANLTLLSETGATRLNATVAGSTYAFAKIFLTRTSTATSTLTPISLMAQLWPTGQTPILTGDHQPGEGHTKVQFADEAIVEDYIFMYPPQKGISTTLEEVI
jgi:hypothetical protein